MNLPHGALLSLLASLALGAPGVAQSRPGKVLVRRDRPLRSASLDLATGSVTHGPAVRARTGTTIADFTNLDLGGFMGTDTGGGACEWIDAARKGFAGNASDLMTNVVFAYCSSMLDPSAGGPGGSVLLGFYEGYVAGGPSPTTAVALLNLTGLPGRSAASCPVPPCTTCYFFDLNLADCIAFADGPIGYSWRFMDVGSIGSLAGTFPYLACVQSCSGPGPDGQGMTDAIDRYCPPGSSPLTFSYGTTPFGSYFTSIAMEIREVRDAEATAATFVGNGDNDHQLAAGAIAIGGAWSTSITLHRPHQGAGNAPMSLRVRASCVNGPTMSSPFGGRPIEVLTNGALALALLGTHGAAQNVPWPLPAFAVPCDITLVGLPWAAQGTVIGGGFADLTDARCGVVGSIDLVADP